LVGLGEEGKESIERRRKFVMPPNLDKEGKEIEYSIEDNGSYLFER